MYKAKITTKGQVTIPKKLRDKIGLNSGDYIEIKETKAGYILKKAVNKKVFQKYVGILNNKNDSAKIIKELRGE